MELICAGNFWSAQIEESTICGCAENGGGGGGGVVGAGYGVSVRRLLGSPGEQLSGSSIQMGQHLHSSPSQLLKPGTWQSCLTPSSCEYSLSHPLLRASATSRAPLEDTLPAPVLCRSCHNLNSFLCSYLPLFSVPQSSGGRLSPTSGVTRESEFYIAELVTLAVQIRNQFTSRRARELEGMHKPSFPGGPWLQSFGVSKPSLKFSFFTLFGYLARLDGRD